MTLANFGTLLSAVATFGLLIIAYIRLRRSKTEPIVVELTPQGGVEKLKQALKKNSLREEKKIKTDKKQINEIGKTTVSDAKFLSDDYLTDLGMQLSLAERKGDKISITVL